MKNKELDEMFDNLEYSDKTIDDSEETQKKRSVVAIIFASIFFLVLISVIVAFLLSQKTTKDFQTTGNQQQTVKLNKKTEVKELDLPNWAKNPYTAMSEEDKNALMSSVKYGTFENMIVSYPSEKDGFTSDPSKEFDEDGLPNIHYTTATQEDIRYFVNLYLNRIINPYFGGWLEYQYTKEMESITLPTLLYGDMFTTEYLNANKNRLPFFIDKNKDDYGLQWPESNQKTAKFVGTVERIDKFSQNQEFTEIQVEAIVKFEGITTEGLATKKQKITMTLFTNKEIDPEINRLKINDIKVEEVND